MYEGLPVDYFLRVFHLFVFFPFTFHMLSSQITRIDIKIDRQTDRGSARPTAVFAQHTTLACRVSRDIGVSRVNSVIIPSGRDHQDTIIYHIRYRGAPQRVQFGDNPPTECAINDTLSFSVALDIVLSNNFVLEFRRNCIHGQQSRTRLDMFK